MNETYYPIDSENKNVHELPCIRCGVVVRRHIDPNALRHYKAYCHHCARHLNKHPPVIEDTSDAPIRWFAQHMTINHGAEPPVVYKPGDPGFEEIAAQCDLQPKSTKKLPHYNPFECRGYN